MSVVTVTPDRQMQQKLNEVLRYQDGAIYWRKTRQGMRADGRAGTQIDRRGYRSVHLDGKRIKEHRVIFLMHHGWLPDCLDHADGDPRNNRIENLRPCTALENGYNRGAPSDNESGYKGVSWHNRAKPWRAQINVNKKRKHLGYFATAKEAHKAYCEAARRYHGTFSNTGHASS